MSETSGPLISVIVPVYEGERFLAEALQSVRSQEGARVELIVVDDGSTDGSGAIAEPLCDRLVRQPNRGVSAARNAGIAIASGELIVLLDQDDVFEPGRLALQAAMLRDDPSLDFVKGRVRLRLEPGSPRPDWWNASWNVESEKALQLGTTLVRRRAFERVGLFDETYAIVGDADWFARAKDLGVAWRAHDDVVLTYRVHERNNVHDRERMLAESLRAMRASVQRQRAAAR